MEKKSEENWVVGNYCLAHDQLNAAANRLYYAVFQAVLDYATRKKGYKYGGHGGHIAMWDIVRSEGKDRLHCGEVFQDLRTLRETADYDKEPPDEMELKNLLRDADRIRIYHLQKAKG